LDWIVWLFVANGWVVALTTEKRAGLEGRNGKPHVAIYRECARQELRKVTWGSRRKSATAQNPDERRRRIVRSAPANVVLDWNDPPRGGNVKTALQLLGQISVGGIVAMKSGCLARSLAHIPPQRSRCVYQGYRFLHHELERTQVIVLM
jgi:hypothetical protein